MTGPAAGPEHLRITRVQGRAVAVRGDDIDTDRIIPARFLRCVTFDGLGEHAFEDDRRGLSAKGGLHPLDDPRHQGAAILVVNRNFGCGSSREHAPQSLLRRGIRALVGESFAEIFFGNCQALGLPCVASSREEVEELMEFAESEPAGEVAIEIATGKIRFADHEIAGHIPGGARDSFLRGTWDATGLLLDRYEEVEAVAERLPYMRGYR
jgi:3-isopropylmalate/(R)-2-methylmalate dehydratase small subunit